jgi:glycosyltransferase involved in cell wall biosynthesis
VTNAPRVLALVGDDTGPTLWRVWSPFAELQRRGVFAHWKHRDDPELLDPIFLARATFSFDAFILPRMSWTNRLANEHWLGAIHRAGLAVILEVDDDLFSPAVVDRMYNVFERERARGRAQLERDRQMRLWLLDQVDGITVTSRRLATVVGEYTQKPVHVVPNAIDVRWFREVLRGVRRVVPPLTVGWAGGARYAEDLAPVAEAWSRIAARFPEVTFVVQGHMAEILIDAVPADRVRRLAWLPLEHYPRALLNIDIGCCSVAPRPFNVAKTPIKVWEFALAGAPCVVSPTLYGPYVSDGEDALVAETADEWEHALERLVSDAALRRRVQRTQRRRVVSEHSLEQNWQRWPIAWTAILERYRARTALLSAAG